ncbi:MAG: hypothetical protein V1676_00725 [Candidatus Diapherotrites archaeon]
MYELIGIVGIVFMLTAFFLNSFKWSKRFTYTYNTLNFLGAVSLFYYATLINSAVFMVLYAVWMYISAFFVIKKVLYYRPAEVDDFDVDEAIGTLGSPKAKPKAKPKPRAKRGSGLLWRKGASAEEGESSSSKEEGTSPTWPWSK